jgi:hypothetical protein
MDLVFIHGPGAVGKLTVGRALTARTGLPLFHNHLVVDTVLAVFAFGSPPFVRLRHAMWLAMFDEAAKAGQSLIFTFAPENSVPRSFIQEVVESVGKHGGQVRFVELTCALAVQEARIEDPSRAAYRKLNSLAQARALRAAGAAEFPPLPAEVTIDTGALSPEEAAERIATALARPRVSA